MLAKVVKLGIVILKGFLVVAVVALYILALSAAARMRGDPASRSIIFLLTLTGGIMADAYLVCQILTFGQKRLPVCRLCGQKTASENLRSCYDFYSGQVRGICRACESQLPEHAQNTNIKRPIT